MKITQWFPGKMVDGVVRIPPSRADLSATRGIVVDRPERFVVNSPFGQLDIAAGDWVVQYASGNRGLVKQADILDHSSVWFQPPWYVRLNRFLTKLRTI